MTSTLTSFQTRTAVAIRDLNHWKLRAPSLQRALDADRVEAILEFQRDRVRRGLEPLFLGDIVVVAQLDGSAWVVDGQHRLEAARRLIDLAPDHLMGLTIVDAAAVSVEEAFRLINKSVPVPDFVVANLLAQRRALEEFGALFAARFKPFLSVAAAPRVPNVNLGALRDEMAAAEDGFVEGFAGGGAELMRFVAWVNDELAAEVGCARAIARARAKDARAPLLIRALPNTWMTRELANRWARDPAAARAEFVKRARRGKAGSLGGEW